jgi:hypothetical protein
MKILTALQALSSIKAHSKHLKVYAIDRIGIAISRVGTWEAVSARNKAVAGQARQLGKLKASGKRWHVVRAYRYQHNQLHHSEISGMSNEASVMGVEQQPQDKFRLQFISKSFEVLV